MSPASAIVLYAVLWFLVMLTVLPVRLRTQGEEGKVVPGTPPGAPANFNLRSTAYLVSAIALIVWAIICGIIVSGVIKITELGWI